MDTLITFDSVQFERGKFRLSVPSIHITPGITLLTGPNGSGKTTFLLLLLGVLTCTVGTIKRSRTFGRYGYLPQDYRQILIPWLSAQKNIALLRSVDLSLATELCAAIGIEADVLKQSVGSLSGGQAQAVALVRELSFDADLVAVDEPFSSLDQSRKTAAQFVLSSIAERRKKTAYVLVTHDMLTPNMKAEVTSRLYLSTTDGWHFKVEAE